jgi:hypothetical protein
MTGFESVHGTTIIPLTGFIDVDATSNNTGMIAGYDLFPNGREFKFSGLSLQADAGGEYVLDG